MKQLLTSDENAGMSKLETSLLLCWISFVEAPLPLAIHVLQGPTLGHALLVTVTNKGTSSSWCVLRTTSTPTY